ncbi:DUF5074 domain-containing protein [Gelidibacter salicanalis]|uniref:DUF5074 domain-containing protein n=1 Tax=Gelidibacter salicanalis TaxID=291193 RepID=A0A934KXZ6_9FLAO|nr:DUF5074 domain-containing protein [Gelidibacter salicanalis]MBJ7882413.1 DUF5074 domain-containing protein [Gelidibacter salicanalis]
MRLNFTFFKQLFLLAFAVTIVGCSNDDAILINPPSVEGSQQLQDTITMGESFLLSPKFSNAENSIFEWIVDGEIVGNDSTYVFIPQTRGTHQVSVQAKNEGGEASLTYDIHTWGAFENGFYLINEGWFGHGTGTVGFYRYDTQKMEDSVFVKTNPTKDLYPLNSTLQFGTVYNEKLYLVSKAGGPVVVSDAYSLVEEQRIPSNSGNNWRAFVGVSETQGLLSSSNGIHKVNLETLVVEGAIPGISGQIGDMVKVGEYIFVLSQREGVIILNAATYEVEKRIPEMTLGFAKTEDNNIWVAGGTTLVKINPSTLETEAIELGFKANSSWGAWHPGSITASANTVFIAKNGSFGGGNEIYSYTNDIASLQNPFIKLPEAEVLYGAGLAFNPDSGQLVVRTVRDGWGENFSYNKLHFYNTASGALENTIGYEGYYFPASPVFH